MKMEEVDLVDKSIEDLRTAMNSGELVIVLKLRDKLYALKIKNLLELKKESITNTVHGISYMIEERIKEHIKP